MLATHRSSAEESLLVFGVELECLVTLLTGVIVLPLLQVTHGEVEEGRQQQGLALVCHVSLVGRLILQETHHLLVVAHRHHQLTLLQETNQQWWLEVPRLPSYWWYIQVLYSSKDNPEFYHQTNISWLIFRRL